MTVTIKCDYCGKEILIYPYEMKKYEHHFCSRECKEVWQSENLTGENSPHWKDAKETIECKNCGKEFEAESANDRQFCSKECWYEWQSDNIRGENHHSWKGGKTQYYGRNWSEQREKALERDNYTCQVCDSKQNLQVHHKKPIRTFDEDEIEEKANRLENLITLCASCHGKVENRGDGV